MKNVFCFFCLFLNTVEKTETSCNVEETILKCSVLENSIGDRKDLSISLHPDGGPSELLVDCAWEKDEPNCILLPGVILRQPVSNIVEISLTRRDISNPKCEPGGSSPEIIYPCQLREAQDEDSVEDTWQEEKVLQMQQDTPNKKTPSKIDSVETEKNSKTPNSVIGNAAGIVALLSLIIFVVWRIWNPRNPIFTF
ncbi:uncharacterized protein LOC112567930 [Pomacea canaliculata]|uniref:uncharacterized protein LOC112567930 n=1 Tax=Pomacea canaliculata TaxID=400727 RepID=UPI000D736259|nr:uncharacterized protein LOC112567930 [Pomacea canaliculata]XP_025100613.1 uncharacterized protein LOC112567930 [Pomacea canaliculata]